MRRKRLHKILVITAIFAGISIIGLSYFNVDYGSLTTELTEIGEYKNLAETTGFFVRSEEVLTTDSSYGKDNLKYLYSDGEKVACNNTFAEVYATPQEASLSYMIDNLDKELSTLEELNNTKYNISKGLSSVNSQINSEINNLFFSINNSELSKVETIKQDLRYLLNERQIILGKDVDFSQKISELKSQKENLCSNKLNLIKSISFPHSGEFISNTDGYENSFDYEHILTMDLSKMNIDNINKSSQPNSIGKIIKSDSWYVLCSVDVSMSPYISKNMEIKLNIPSQGPEKYYPCKIEEFSRDSSGEKLNLIISCDYMNKDLAYLRKENIKIVFDTFNGLIVNSESLHKSDDCKELNFGVYIKIGDYIKWKNVVPVFLGKTTVVCKYDAEESVNEKYLQPGDNVVIGGKDLYEGKRVK